MKKDKFNPDSLPYSCTDLKLIQQAFPQGPGEMDAIEKGRGYKSLKYFSDIIDLKNRCPDLKVFTTNSMLVIPDKDKWIINRQNERFGLYEEDRQKYELKIDLKRVFPLLG